MAICGLQIFSIQTNLKAGATHPQPHEYRHCSGRRVLLAAISLFFMTHGSIFSGIGGFDLAAEWMEWENLFHCEWNEFGKKVLNYYWPKAISYGDITKTDFTIWRGRIDVISGGFPCQPYSNAGKRLGKEDERHLWPEMYRAIWEIQPSYVVGENVRGLTNWNGGMVFDEVQADLETLGYEVTPFLLPACAVNAPHRRDRIWFVAFKNTDENGRRSNERKSKPNTGELRNFSSGNNEQLSADNGEIISNATNTRSESLQRQKKCNDRSKSITNTNGWRWDGICIKKSSGKQNKRTFGIQNCGLNATYSNGFRLRGKINRGRTSKQFDKNSSEYNWGNFPTQSPVCNGNDGFPSGLDGITFSKWKSESIKAGGNAIVPQVAFQIFKAIGAHERLFSYGCQ